MKGGKHRFRKEIEDITDLKEVALTLPVEFRGILLLPYFRVRPKVVTLQSHPESSLLPEYWLRIR